MLERIEFPLNMQAAITVICYLFGRINPCPTFGAELLRGLFEVAEGLFVLVQQFRLQGVHLLRGVGLLVQQFFPQVAHQFPVSHQRALFLLQQRLRVDQGHSPHFMALFFLNTSSELSLAVAARLV